MRASLLTFCCILFTTWGALAWQSDFPGNRDDGLGLNPDKRLTQYLTRNWTVENGLPYNNILAGTQTPDGYLWFGGYAGLVRFDGVSFTHFNSQTDSAFSTDGVYDLYADDQNQLWIGTQAGGLLQYTQGRFRQVFTDSVLRISSVYTMASASNGALWLATSEGLFCYQNDSLYTPAQLSAVASLRIRELHVDQAGHLWVGTSNQGLYQYTGDTLLHVDQVAGLPSNAIYSLAEGSDGYMWVGTLNGMAKVDHLARVIDVYRNEKGQPTRSLDAAYIDNKHTLWVGGIEGLGRYHQGKWTSFEPRVGFQLKEISTLFQDRQGTLWVGTYRHGIWQITDGKFASFSIPEGLSGDVVYALHPEQNQVYVGTESGLSIVNSTKTINYTVGSGNDNFIRDIQRDKKGRLWLCTYGGLMQWQQGEVVRKLGVGDGLSTNRVRTVVGDTQGDLWIGTTVGLQRFQGDSIYTPKDLEPLAKLFILSLYLDRNNTLWIGTNGNGLYAWDGQVLSQYTRADGLGNDFVFRMAEDAEGRLWIGTTGGLTRYDNGQFATLTPSHGLPSQVVFQALPDRQGRLWGIGDANVWTASIADLNATLDGKNEEIAFLQTFDKYDGLLAGQPTAVSVSAIGQQDRLYVCTPLGYSVLDLTSDHSHPYPSMLIDIIETDAGSQRPQESISLAPGNRQMEIHYTAFDYYAPQALHFQYKLEGFDEDWIMAENRRVAIYTSLPPGSYTFRLKVASHDEEWAKTSLDIPVHQEAWFYQTNAFKVILFFIFVGVGMIIHYSRIRLLDAHNKRLSQLVTKRTYMIEKQKEAFGQQARMLESSYLKINDSIQYARRIQDALLPSANALKQVFPESFILYRPKDVVSGDFYWFHRSGDLFFMAVVDCTGHGIPGAFMSVLGNTLLSQIVNQQHIHQPAAILNELHQQTVLHLQQDDHSYQMQDGMDAAIVAVDVAAGKLSYAGAKRPLVYFNATGMQKISGDRNSIGSPEMKGQAAYTQHNLMLSEIRRFLLFSDGYADQFGGPQGKKFMNRQFYSLLEEISGLSAKEQANRLETTWLEWRGQEDQVDDILVVGVCLS